MSKLSVHLQIYSEYSIDRSIICIDELIALAKQYKIPALALTDMQNLCAMVKFYQACIKEGIKPILGCHLLIKDKEQTFGLLLYCQNSQGFQNLNTLISLSYMDAEHRLPKEALTPERTENLLAIIPSSDSEFRQLTQTKHTQKKNTKISFWQARFPNRFYVGLSRYGHPEDEIRIQQDLELATLANWPTIALHPTVFLKPEQFQTHEARVCIHNGEQLHDPQRTVHFREKQYFLPAAELQQVFSDLPIAVENACYFAQRCNFHLPLEQLHLPEYPTNNALSIDIMLEKQSLQKLEPYLTELEENARKTYIERLTFEVSIIKKMGFSAYFMIVADFISWAKKQNIPVGPGRGSGAGSIVAYALGITTIDPIKHQLLFERFLNPERVSMPDFDIDFCMEQRDKVIQYVTQRYGQENVAQIMTYGTMAARGVLRDVGRVLGHPYGMVDSLAKLVPMEIGMTLSQALKQEPQLQERYDQDPEVTKLLNLGLELEGLVRNVGKHAGGVVISPKPLQHFCPLYREAPQDPAVTQLDKDDLETLGLVKFDFLGLRTLTIIHWTLKTLKESLGLSIDIEKIPLDDPKTFNLLQSGKCTAIFQLESRGMQELIFRLQPDIFEDIVALVALYRPGPLQSGMVDDFVDRKHGRQTIRYPHIAAKDILEATYGVILYQEQVMQLAQVLSGYSLGQADILRKAMGKKKHAEMAKQRDRFTEGAIKNNIPEDKAEQIFDLMEKFAGYGFNKSHSVCYALLSYQTAWLKAHHKTAFMAAVLSADLDNTDKINILLKDCKKQNITITPPHINESHSHFTRLSEDSISYALSAIKGIGQGMAEQIVKQRQQPFDSLFDLCRRLQPHKINKKTLEALICSGSLDCWKITRAKLFASIDIALQDAVQYQRNVSSKQQDLFNFDQQAPNVQYQDAKPWSLQLKLKYEKQFLGLYLSGHPLDPFREELKQMAISAIQNISPQTTGPIRVAGFLTDLRIIQNRQGKQLALATIDDGQAETIAIVTTKHFPLCQEKIALNTWYIIDGKREKDRFKPQYRIQIEHLRTIEDIRVQYPPRLIFHIPDAQLKSLLSKLESTLKTMKRGPSPIIIAYQDSAEKISYHQCSDTWSIAFTNTCQETLEGSNLSPKLQYPKAVKSLTIKSAVTL
jgi:DNA polymerase III subunit alpha